MQGGYLAESIDLQADNFSFTKADQEFCAHHGGYVGMVSLPF